MKFWIAVIVVLAIFYFLGKKPTPHQKTEGQQNATTKKQPSSNTAKATAISKPTVKKESVIDNLWNYGSETAWNEALAHYYEIIRAEALEIENYIENIDATEVAQLSATEFYDFLHDKYFVWKYTAKNRLATTRKSLRRYVEEGKLSELADIQRRLFSADHTNISRCLSIATEIRGLGAAGASGLLAVLFPKDFGTIDQFVVKALREVDGLPYAAELAEMNPESLSVKNGVLIIKILREQAEKLNQKFNTDFWTPRKIDMILWSIGR